MRYIVFIFALSVLCIQTSAVFAQSQSTKSSETFITFNVQGVCEMCKQRIEQAAKGKGVNEASWNMQTKLLTLRYNPSRTTTQKVKSRIADAGYDTDDQKAADKDYGQLPSCCRYREFSSMEVIHKADKSIPIKSIETDTIASTAQQESPEIKSYVVKGTVLEKEQNGSLKPLPGASVIWLGSRIGTSTDSAGVFTLTSIGEQRKLIISYVGLEADTVTIEGEGEVKVVLRAVQQLKEIKVSTGGRQSTYISAYEPMRKFVITQKELMKAACCNLSESFETNPSVDVSFNDAVTGSKQIQLLGLSGNYTQLTVENLPGPRGLATPLGLNSIPGTWIESIQLVKGTGSVANGFESIAGQINVELKKPSANERLYANMYVNDFGKTDLNLNLMQKIGKKWSTTLLLHNAFLNNKRIDFNGDGFRDLPTGNLFSVVNRWGFENGKGLSTHFGVKLLTDDKTGGQITFDPQKHKLTTDVYGVQIKTNRAEVFGKLGYIFPGKPHKSIGLQVSTFQHELDSYFGLTTYDGEQKNMYSNLIYQSQIGSAKHKFRTGLSFVYDQYDERFNATEYKRKEAVTGGFFEYTFSPSQYFDVVAGLREDYNHLYGWFTTPRLNVRYQPFASTVIRVNIGRGQRTANIFAENNIVFVSARKLNIVPSTTGKAYGLNPEIAWNKGISVDQKFRIFNRSANLSLEYFRNDFKDQIIVDLEDPAAVNFYNLKGESFANSFQTELSFEPLRKLNVRLAYRYFDIKTTYGDVLLEKPFTAKHRGFVNLGYEVSGWKFDYTVSYNGSKRIPSTEGLPGMYIREDHSPVYTTMNAQISQTLGKSKNIDLYIGGENLTNFFQREVITAADQPFGQFFDASQIWGLVNGRMLYGGFRITIKQAE